MGGERLAGDSRADTPDSILAADALALRLRAACDALLVPLGHAAFRLVRSRLHTVFGFARLDDYARERLGRSGRWLRDVAAVGEGFERMPELIAAVTGLDGGAPIGRVPAVLVARAATPESIAEWVRIARNATVRELRAAVARARGSAHEAAPGEEAAAEGPEAARPAPVHGAVSEPDRAAGRDDAEDRKLVRLLVPAPVKAAFEETLDLHRAVEGHEATVTSFIEALVAEAHAGPHPPDADAVHVRSGAAESQLEEILARVTDRWSRLPVAHANPSFSDPVKTARTGGGAWADADGPLAVASEALNRFDDLVATRGGSGPDEIDGALRELICLEDALRRGLGGVLAELSERGAWSTLLFRGVAHYAEQRLGLGRTSCADRARLHRALRRFPLVREAYERGELRFESALLVVRLLEAAPAQGGVEEAWIDRAREVTIKRLRDETRHLARERLLDSRLGSRAPLDDAAWHATLRREPGMTARRVWMMGGVAVRDGFGSSTGCGGGAAAGDECARSASAPGPAPASGPAPGAGAVVPGTGCPGSVGGCPDVFLRLRLPADLADAFLATVEGRRRRWTREVEAVPWDEPWPDPHAAPSILAARSFSVRCRRVPAWVCLLAMLEDYVATWDDPAAAPARDADRIYRRDGWRCAAPGCTSRRNLEDHHLRYRSRGGDNDESNRTCLCRFHHQRGEHGGLARCRGTAPLDITWRLGRKDVATYYRNERALRGAESFAVGELR